LGFSFDTLRDAELRAAVKKQDPNAPGRTTARSKPVKPKADAAPKPAVAKPAPSGRPGWLIPAAVAALVLVIGLLSWLMLKEEKLTEAQLTTLRVLTRSFDDHLQRGELVQPNDDNAMTSLIAMRNTSTSHKLVTGREQLFREAIDSRLGEMISGRQWGSAQGLLDAARRVLSEESYAEGLTKLQNARESALKDDQIIALVGELEAIQEKPGWLREPRLAAALSDLEMLAGADDSRYQKVSARLGKTLGDLLDKATADKDLARAGAIRDSIVDLLPRSETRQQADAKITRLTAQLEAEQTQSALTALLRQRQLGVNGVTQAVGWLDSLRAAELGAATLAPLERSFLEKVTAEAQAATRSNNLQVARALLDPTLVRFPDNQPLQQVLAEVQRNEETIRQQLAAEQARLKAGRLALDATPWAQVVSITGADGQPVDLKGKKNTPFSLTLPEGQYTVVMKSPDGKTQQESSATVNRGQDSLARLEFAKLDADSYLQEAGYR